MKAIQKDLRATLIFAILLSFALVGGIPAIIFGSSYGITPLLVIGIVCTAVGFYGTPMMWIAYSGKSALQRVVLAVTEEHLYSVDDIAAQLAQQPDDIRGKLDKCFQKRYLPGYRRDGDSIILNDGTPLSQKTYKADCPYCGATYTYTADKPLCPYCGSPAPTDDQKK